MKRNIKTYFTLLLSVMFMQVAFAQSKTITGTVTDANGLPIPGVNIIIKGTDSGTMTNFEGHYTLEAETGQTLVFSYIGFKTVSKVVGTSDVIDVALEESAQTLDKVVVTAFGREMTRNETTASVVTVGSEEIEKSPYVGATKALQGKVSGLTLHTSSGVPGSSPQIRIRGINSINASNAPLYVIDGVPVNSGNVSGNDNSTSMNILSLINPSDIKSITVLKDASAVAPYGAEGANGVILITTKSGSRTGGDAQFTVNYSTGVQNQATDGLEMASAQQRFDAVKRGLWNTYGSGQFGAGLIPSKDKIVDWYTANIGNEIQHWIDLGKPNTNWRDAISNKDAVTNNISIGVSQGTEKSQLHASIGFNETEGTVIGSDYRRLTGSVNYNTELTDKLDFHISAMAANARQNGIREGDAYFANPNLARYFLSSWAVPYEDDGSYNIDDFTAYSGGLYNPLYSQTHNLTSNDVTRGLVNTSLKYEIIEDLTFSTKLALDYSLTYYKLYFNPIHGPGETTEGAAEESSMRLYTYTTQNMLDYRFTLNDKHNFDVAVVQEFSKYKNSYLYGSGENFPNANLKNLSASSANWQAISTFSDRMSMRYVGMLNYNFDQRYLINATYSYQGDSRFSDKWGSFYSVGLGWNLHEENFMTDVDFVDVLRLRTSYGIVGNAGIGRNEYQALLGYGTYRGNPAAFVVGYGTEATWEIGKRFDVGLNFALFNRRLTGSLGYYNNLTTDMLLNTPLPLSAQYLDAVVLRNVGEMKNTGFEMQLDGTLIQTPDFKWNMGVVFSTVSNEITDIPEDAQDVTGSQVIQKGHAFREWHMREWAGIDPDNGLPLWYIDRTQSDATTSDYSQAKKVYQGTSPLPTYHGSISTRFDYKNFFLEATLYFSGGNQVMERWASYTRSSGVYSRLFNVAASTVEGAWTHPGDVSATAPRFDYANNSVSNATAASTRWLYDGDYMRLRSLGFGYSFNPEVVKKIGLDGLTLSVRGTNLFTWVKDDRLQFDPEISLDGYTNLTTPAIKTILFNVNLKF